jgi:predicted PurR-regulated permease PerM
MDESKQAEPHQQPTTQSGWLSRERLLALVLIVTTALAFYICYRLALPFLPALTWALALTVVAYPIREIIAKRIKNLDVAAGLTVALVAILIVTPAVFLAHQLVVQTSRGIQALKSQAESGQLQAAIESNPQMSRILGWFGPVDVRAAGEWVANSLGPYLSSFVGGSIWTVAQFVITLFTLFYLLRDQKAFLKEVKSLLPLSQSETYRIFARVGDTIYATIYGTLAVSLVQGLLGGLMFWWLGLPAPLLWGVAMFLLSLVPVLGAPVVWIPATIFLVLTGSWWKAIILAVWGTVVIGSIDNLLYPVLVGDRIRMHTLLVFFSVVGGLMLFGAAGLVLGPVVVVVTKALVEVWRGRTSGGHVVDERRNAEAVANHTAEN